MLISSYFLKGSEVTFTKTQSRMKKNVSIVLILLIASLNLSGQIDFSNRKMLKGPGIAEMDSLIAAGYYGKITSVVVAHNSKVVLEKYYADCDETSKHNTRSATKSLATILTGIAIDKGHIDSEKDLVFKYLKHKLPIKNPDPRKDAITIEDLLTMSSVLECDDWNDHSRGHEERMYFIEDWTQFLLDLPVRSYPFGPKPADRPYGRAFAYGSAKAAAVGDIVENAVGMKLDQFAKKNLFEPLEITDYSLHYTPMGVMNTAGGSEYRSRDFLKMIQMCLNKGKWNGQQLVSSKWLAKATSPKAHAYDELDYGYFFWLGKFGDKKKYESFFMGGNGGNKVMAIPELGLSIVITAQNYNTRGAHGYTDEMINKYIIPAVE